MIEYSCIARRKRRRMTNLFQYPRVLRSKRIRFLDLIPVDHEVQ